MKKISLSALLSIVLAACGSSGSVPNAASVNYNDEQWDEITTSNMKPVDIFQYAAKFLSEMHLLLDMDEIENDAPYIQQMRKIMDEAPEHAVHDQNLNIYVSQYNGLPIGLVDIDTGRLIEPGQTYKITDLTPVNLYTCRARDLSLDCRDSFDAYVNAKQVGDNAIGRQLLEVNNFHALALLSKNDNSIRCYGSVCFLNNGGYIIGTLQDRMAYFVTRNCQRRGSAIIRC